MHLDSHYVPMHHRPRPTHLPAGNQHRCTPLPQQHHSTAAQEADGQPSLQHFAKACIRACTICLTSKSLHGSDNTQYPALHACTCAPKTHCVRALLKKAIAAVVPQKPVHTHQTNASLINAMRNFKLNLCCASPLRGASATILPHLRRSTGDVVNCLPQHKGTEMVSPHVSHIAGDNQLLGECQQVSTCQGPSKCTQPAPRPVYSDNTLHERKSATMLQEFLCVSLPPICHCSSCARPTQAV